MRDCARSPRPATTLPPENVRFINYSLSSPFVQGDPEELRSAVSNLLENAVKYSPGKIVITIEILDEASDLLVRVTDKGQGIPQGELNRIFRRFYRVNERLRQRVQGTGLGLFIVRGIARRHGGSAYATSEGEGRGATVTQRLPRDSFFQAALRAATRSCYPLPDIPRYHRNRRPLAKRARKTHT